LIYLDTSVLAPFYWTEAMTNSVADLFQQSQTLIISELSEVELMSALSRRVRMKEIEREDAIAIAIVNQFQMHITSGLYEKLPITIQHYQTAKSWIQHFDTPLRTLGALHLAVANEQQVPLITADVGLARSAVSLNINVQLLTP
jgi:predicted nucleic acid-binding protein